MLPLTRFTVALAALLLATIVAPQIAARPRNGRIVGGTEAARSEFPYVVSLTRRGGHQCGAIVLSSRWLLSAGHCVCNGVGRLMRAAQLQAVLGQHSLSEFRDGASETNRLSLADGSAYRMDLDRIVVPVNYACHRPRDDIAMLRTARELRLSASVQFAQLPSASEMKAEEEATFSNPAIVCGWGWTAEDLAAGQRADRLRKAAVTVWPAARCERMYASSGEPDVRFARGQMCAGREDGGVDACWADSGGPLVGGTDGRTVIGVVSTGIGCGRPGLPGIYTEVAVYIEWIEAVLRSRESDDDGDGIVSVI